MPGADTERRTRTVAVAGSAVVLLLWVTTMTRDDSDPTPPGDTEVAAECRRLYTQFNPTFRALPDQRFEVRQGDELLRVYVSEPDEWIGICRSGPTGVVQTFGNRMTDGPAGQLRLYGAEDAGVESDLVLGSLPTGATAIEARLPSGETVTGGHDGDVFAVWTPRRDMTGAQLTATGPDATVLATTTVP